MVNAQSLSTDIANTIVKNGNRCSFQYYTSTFSGTDYDNEFITGSKLIWGYCMIQPLKASSASTATLLEQGRVNYEDKVAYITGSLSISANLKLGIGSPNTNTYKILPEGIIPYYLGSGTNPVYQKCFIRDLNLGSFTDIY